GIATVRIEQALLIPAEGIDGRTVEFVLQGSAWFTVEPPDEIEAGQLELFTGHRRIDAPIETAVLSVADQRQVAALLDRYSVIELDAERLATAAATYAQWVGSVERRATGAEAGMFKALYGDPVYRDYFALWCVTRGAGELVYTYDPGDAEQLTIASFNRPQVRGWDRVRLERHIRFQQRKGRFLDTRIDDLGAWDIWLSTSWSPNGSDASGDHGFETRHYDLDVRVSRDRMRLEGQATLELETTAAGRQTVSLELFRDLELDSVRDGLGRELFAFRSGPEIVVGLPDRPAPGDRLTLHVGYHGRVLDWRGKGTFDLVTTDGWYPHCGSIDRATYDVTLRWPRKLDLLAGGKLVASGEDGRYRWERRVLDVPSIAFTFVVGKYEISERQIDDTRLRLAFSGTVGPPSPTMRERTVDVIARSLRFLEGAFGRYPLDELTVVVLPRGYSQSFLGFIALNDTIAGAAEAEPFDAGRWKRETTIAHELAHQWWGNLVGWWSYRDQWLSEAMANYAGMLFHVHSAGGGDALLAELSAGWRTTLEQRIDDGRTVESLGPIVLGSRLNSSRAANGYGAIVYRKGAVVLAMLARAVGEERFLEIVRGILESHRGRVLQTEDFIAAVEQGAGLELDGFAGQYVYGTGIPFVYYDYDVDHAASGGSAWRLQGEARRLLEVRHTFHVVAGEDGRWDVVRRLEPRGGGEGTAVMVPFRIVPSERAVDHPPGARPSQSGRLMLNGRAAEFEIESKVEPDELIFDPWGEILAHFYSDESSPKRVARLRGQDLLVEGKPEEAERELLEALELPLGTPRLSAGAAWRSDAVGAERDEDAAIHLILARLYIDGGQDERAEPHIRAADELLDGRPWDRRLERDVLRARVDLRSGRAAAAYKRLKPTLGIAQSDPRHPRRDGARLRLQNERLALIEAYAVMAVAAYATGHATDYEWARDAALENGVDIGALAAVAKVGPRP
ncbi:MAG TPA: M1 family aminopeptidase, partial [Candidatus Polarisedimenticolaceae bacterium]|nr:M1 family aminopeptidase [Candidatus Polarisedimenticolaceae bacterium]